MRINEVFALGRDRQAPSIMWAITGEASWHGGFVNHAVNTTALLPYRD